MFKLNLIMISISIWGIQSLARGPKTALKVEICGARGTF